MRRFSSISLNSILALSSSNFTGNTTGDIWSRTTRSKLVSSVREPQILNELPF